MVYFGKRRFRDTRAGLTERDRIRLVVPLLMFLGVVLLFFYLEVSSRDHAPMGVGLEEELAASMPAREGSRAEESESAGVVRGQVSPAVPVTPLPDPNSPPAPFEEDVALLASVRDEEIPTEGEAELAGLAHLFHRERSGVAEPARASPPAWEEYPRVKGRIRGRRFPLYLTLVEEPLRREMGANPSGVRVYWEVFASDDSSHLHRVLFIDKPETLPRGTEVFTDAAFLRLHRYETIRGKVGAVPQWAALRLEEYVRPVREGASWRPLLIVGGISLLTLAICLVLILRHGGSPSTGRRRRPRRRRAPSPGGASGTE